MKRILALGVLGTVLVVVCSPAHGRLVASDEESGRIPTVSVGVTIVDPRPPRIEVRAQPSDRVRIKQEIECTGRNQRRAQGRQIRTKPPFSGRLALTIENPMICTFVVVAQYVEASEPDDSLKTGAIKLRLYH